VIFLSWRGAIAQDLFDPKKRLSARARDQASVATAEGRPAHRHGGVPRARRGGAGVKPVATSPPPGCPMMISDLCRHWPTIAAIFVCFAAPPMNADAILSAALASAGDAKPVSTRASHRSAAVRSGAWIQLWPRRQRTRTAEFRQISTLPECEVRLGLYPEDHQGTPCTVADRHQTLQSRTEKCLGHRRDSPERVNHTPAEPPMIARSERDRNMEG